MEKRNWMQKLADDMDLPAEPMPGVPVVELADTCRVLVERHGGVIEYSRQRIIVKMRYGTVWILGCDLKLACMTRNQLVITGRIDGIELHRREK